MRKQYILYLSLLPILYVIYSVQKSYSTDSPFFYGFAENKETELSHMENVSISEIFVTQGEAVAKGQILMKVERDILEQKLIQTDFSKLDNSISVSELKGKLESELLAIDTELKKYKISLNDRIEAIKYEDRTNRQIQAVMKTIEKEKSNQLSEKAKNQIKYLNDQSNAYIALKQIEKENINRRLVAANASIRLDKAKRDHSVGIIKTEFDELSIKAPANGVIGNIPTKRGEKVKSHTTLMTFYEENPTMVKGYVHESLLIHVNIGDSLTISSTLGENNTTYGKVIGLGSRIVEIPERLRKNPTIKSYGREVFVQIPPNNGFLQKEKVSINSDADYTAIGQRKQSNRKLEKRLRSKLSIK